MPHQLKAASSVTLRPDPMVIINNSALFRRSEAMVVPGNAIVRSPSDVARLQRALGYPYARPDSSFIFVSGEAYTFDDSTWQGPSQLDQLTVSPLSGMAQTSMQQVLREHGVQWPPSEDQNQWTPVLAIGSNAGVKQLARKFPNHNFPDGVVIPVLRCVLRDFDVVYSPMIVSYGSCTATLEYSPGTAIAVFVTYLQPLLLQRMHETEGAYNLCLLNNITLHLGQSLAGYTTGRAPVEVLRQMYQYNHQVGSLYMPFTGFKAHGGTPVALQAIAASGRRFLALTQRQMLLAVRHALRDVETTGALASLDPPVDSDSAPAAAGPDPMDIDAPKGASANGAAAIEAPSPAWLADTDGGLEDWILRNLDDPLVRHTYVSAMSAAAKPFQYKDTDMLMALGNLFSDNVQ